MQISSVFIVLIPYVVLMILSARIYKYVLNPVSLYSTVWLLFAFLSLQGIWGMYIPSLRSIFYILVGTLCFCLTSFITYLLYKNKNLSEVESSVSSSKHNFSILILVNVLGIIWLLPFVSKTIPILMTGDWALVRIYYLNANTINVIFSTKQALICQWIIFPIFYVTTIISAYLVAQKKGSFFLSLISIVGIVMIVLATAGRNALFKCLLFYILAFLMNSKFIKDIFLKIKESRFYIKVLVFCGAAAIIFISSQRSLSNETSALQNVFFYFTSPIIYFSHIIDNPNQYALNEPLFGRATFGFISTPVEIGYSMVSGQDYSGADNIVTSYVNQYINFSPTIKGNAVSTSLYPFMKDFGLFGLILGPCIYGFIVSRIYVNQHKNAFWSCLSLYMLYTVFFSEWQYELLFPQSFSIIALLYVFVAKQPVIRRKRAGASYIRQRGMRRWDSPLP